MPVQNIFISEVKCWLQDNFEKNKQFLQGYFDISVFCYRFFSLMLRTEALKGPLAFTFSTISPRLLCHLPFSSFDLRRPPKINLLLAPDAVPALLSAPLSSILCSQGAAGHILAMNTPNLGVWVHSESLQSHVFPFVCQLWHTLKFEKAEQPTLASCNFVLV